MHLFFTLAALFSRYRASYKSDETANFTMFSAVASIAVVAIARFGTTRTMALWKARRLTIPTRRRSVGLPFICPMCVMPKKPSFSKIPSLCAVSVRAAVLGLVVDEEAGRVVGRTAPGWILASQKTGFPRVWLLW